LSSTEALNIFAQLNVPIGQVDKVLPAVMLVEGEINLNEGTPLRPLGFSNQVQACLLRSAVGLECITLDTGTDNVFPSGRTAAVPWQNMIQVEILAITGFAAVLAGIAIAFEDVMPGKLDLFFGNMIVNQQ